MGAITARRKKNGTLSYTAQIRLKSAGKVVFTEAETFTRKALAQEWLTRREAQLQELRARGRALNATHTLGELILIYVEDVGPTAQWGRSKQADLKRLQTYALAKKKATTLTVQDFIQHALDRRDDGAAPQTVLNDFIWIGEVLKSARSSLNLPIHLDVLEDARHEMRKQRLIAKSKRRDRRTLPDEETKLLEHFKSRDERSDIPMYDIMQFAVLTARRQEEITRIKRKDLDRKKGTAWLDDVKHPRQKKGNRREFRLLPEAWEIIDRQPMTGPLVFPYNSKSIGTAFRKACRLLGIHDLHFHDLRHESTSRLFERGYAIQEVQQFTLHESWESLKRYTHLKPENVPARAAQAVTR